MSNTVFVIKPADKVEDIHIVRYDFDPTKAYTIVNCSSSFVFFPGREQEETHKNIVLTDKDTGVTVIGTIDVRSVLQDRPASTRITLKGKAVFSTKADARAAAKEVVKAIQVRDRAIKQAEEQHKTSIRAALGVVYY